MNYIVPGTNEMIGMMIDGTAKEGDVCEIKDLNGTNATYLFKDGGWNCIRTKDPDYKHLYESGPEQ